jgi:hypothetical protein
MSGETWLEGVGRESTWPVNSPEVRGVLGGRPRFRGFESSVQVVSDRFSLLLLCRGCDSMTGGELTLISSMQVVAVIMIRRVAAF